jgi:hypothetical protein
VVRVAEVGVDGWVVKMCVVLLLHFILTWIFFWVASWQQWSSSRSLLLSWTASIR